MSAAWPKRPIGELCELINGRAFKPEDWGKKGLPIVRIQNLNDPARPFNYYVGAYSEKHLVDTGDVLLSWSGTPGTSFGCFVWARGKALLNQHIFKVRINRKLVSPDYFVFATNSRLREMIQLAHGAAGLRHITKGKLEQIKLPIPPFEEQHRIVAHIKECMQRVDEVESLRTSCDQETSKVLRSFYRETYLRLKGSNNTTPLTSVGRVTGGGTPSTKNCEFWSGNIPWVSPKDMKRRDIELTIDTISRAALSGSAVKLIDKPSVLFVVRGMILAHTLPVAVNLVPVTINQDMKAITPNNDFLVDYIAAMLRGAESELLGSVEIAGHGTCRLQTARWKSLPIPSLPLEEQSYIVQSVREFETQVDLLRDSSPKQEVAILRESILQRSFAGEL